MTELITVDSRPLTYDHALHGRSGLHGRSDPNGRPGPNGRPARWRGLVAIVLFVIGYLLLSAILGGIAFAIELVRGELTVDDLTSGAVPFTPVIMLVNNLSLAACLPLAMLLQRLFFGVRPGTLSSVTGRFRWRWLGRLALVIVPVWIVYVAVSLLTSPTDEVRMDPDVLALLVIVLLTTPLQAAGEEYGARGLIQRSVGSWFGSPLAAFVLGTLVSAGLFAGAHFAGDPWLIAYYFVFGVSGSLAARGTGGLEAPVLVHAVNNVLLFIPAILLGQLDQGIDRSAGAGGPFILLPMALCLAAAGFSTWWARRNRVATTVPQAVHTEAPETPPAETAPAARATD